LPDISKIGGDKKAKVEAQGVVSLKGEKGDFSDFSFKEGNTNVVKLQDIFIQEKGKDALKKLDEHQAQPAAAKVKGGAKGKKKAASKSKKVEKKSESTDVRKQVGKIVKYTPSKSAGKKDGTPQKSAAKRSTSKKTPAMPSPGGTGKGTAKTTDQMTMAQFKKYLDWHEKKKGGKVLGKRSAGKASTASGKKS